MDHDENTNQNSKKMNLKNDFFYFVLYNFSQKVVEQVYNIEDWNNNSVNLEKFEVEQTFPNFEVILFSY
jgi:general stress protein 26